MKKQAFLVRASVMTRVVIDVPDDFDEDVDDIAEVSMDLWEDVVNKAIPRLQNNLNDFECIEEVEPDYDFPYDKNFDAFEWGK